MQIFMGRLHLFSGLVSDSKVYGLRYRLVMRAPLVFQIMGSIVVYHGLDLKLNLQHPFEKIIPNSAFFSEIIPNLTTFGIGPPNLGFFSKSLRNDPTAKGRHQTGKEMVLRASQSILLTLIQPRGTSFLSPISPRHRAI